MIARTKYARVIDQIERRRDDCARLSKSFPIFIAYCKRAIVSLSVYSCNYYLKSVDDGFAPTDQ